MKEHTNNKVPNVDTTLRNAFLDNKEMSEYVAEMNSRLQSGEKIEGVSFSSIGVTNFLKFYEAVKKKINKLECNDETKCCLIEEIKSLLGLNGKDTKMVNNIDKNLNNEFHYRNDYLKNLLAETLVELVEEGIFDESQMKVVENQIALLLNSIEDYCPILELER
ncbi:MAG: hypothetical protein ACI4PF_00400 [Christensenellales bacterium]